MFQALQAMGFDFDWARDLPTLSQGFPDAVLKNAKLLNQYYQAMELARERSGLGPLEAPSCKLQAADPDLPAATGVAQEIGSRTQETSHPTEDPGEYLMIMGGTVAGMVLSQVALPDHPLFYVGFPITPAGNPFYAMAEAYANGHPYVVVDEVNPSEKVAAEKLIGIARVGGFLPVTFTASQGWRLFTEIIPQFVGARLEGLFLITKRALAAPNLNIEESHTDFMSFRDDGGIMLAPKGIQEYVATLYLARLLTHFAKLPVIVSIGGITDTHKIGLVKVPTDERVRSWLEKTLAGFDFLEHKIINRQGDVLVHGPSGTSAVYQETQSEIEKAHMAAMRVYRYGLQAVYELTGDWIGELEVQCQGDAPRGHREQSVMVGGQPMEAMGAVPETLFVLQGSLFPNAVEALRSLEREGWTGMGCLSVRCFNPFPEEPLAFWLNQSRRVVVLDRSNSFGSIPPLASRIFTTCARCCKMDGDFKLPILRTLVGGLGGREITVDEMKDILLSTHLLFRSRQPWEEPLVVQWLNEDEALRALLAEVAALDWRSVQRHTRVPDHLRSLAAEQEEYRNHLERLKLLLIRRDYPAFLANYHQVEFVAPREVLQETTLLQQIVVRLEVRLARQALASGRGDWRHALVLLHYGREGRDQEAVVAALRDGIEKGRIKSGLLEHYGVAGVDMGHAPHDESPQQPIEENVAAPMEGAETSASADLAAGEGGYRVSFDTAEAHRIESIIQELVQVQSDRAWFFNPEDYEHELLTRLQATPASPLFAVRERHAAVPADQILRSYRQCYRDVFHRSLQWEVLTQHHVPELKELFAGDGLCRLQALADKFAAVLADDAKEHLSDTVQAELERHLTERCIPHLRHSPIVYLEYFRTWVAPELIGKALAPKETSQLS
jgi:pyruvate/2-oxoacid:ferredoxin oxidoreductase alpha subunit